MVSGSWPSEAGAMAMSRITSRSASSAMVSGVGWPSGRHSKRVAADTSHKTSEAATQTKKKQKCGAGSSPACVVPQGDWVFCSLWRLIILSPHGTRTDGSQPLGFSSPLSPLAPAWSFALACGAGQFWHRVNPLRALGGCAAFPPQQQKSRARALFLCCWASSILTPGKRCSAGRGCVCEREKGDEKEREREAGHAGGMGRKLLSTWGLGVLLDAEPTGLTSLVEGGVFRRVPSPPPSP
jgi:hypothetical protein